MVIQEKKLGKFQPNYYFVNISEWNGAVKEYSNITYNYTSLMIDQCISNDYLTSCNTTKLMVNLEKNPT